MYQNHKDFVSDDDIRKWCYSPGPCDNASLRPGVNGRSYVYCMKYKRPAWRILTLCKEDKKNDLAYKAKLEVEAKKQKTLPEFSRNVIL